MRGERHRIESHRKLRVVQVDVDGRTRKRKRPLNFHTYDELRKGDRVLVLSGMLEDHKGTVVKTRSRYDGYTYEVRKVQTHCKCCGRVLP